MQDENLKTEVLPNGAGPAKATADFRNVVAQSKAKIHAETASPGSPKKRRPGRPSAAEAAARKKASETPAPDIASMPTSPQSVAGPTPAPDISPYLQLPLMSLSKIPAS